MNRFFVPAIKVWAIVPILTLVLSGCANFGTDRPPEEVVTERAQGWMDALLAGDVDKAYAYTSPNYRQFSDAGRYNARVAGAYRWETGVVHTVSCEGSVCEVRFMIEYDIKQMGIRNRRPLDYKWIETDGKWWVYVASK